MNADTIFEKKTIFNLIAKGDLDTAIEYSRKLDKDKYPLAHKSIVILSCRYQLLWRSNLVGAMETEDKDRIINKIAAGLYDIINTIDHV